MRDWTVSYAVWSTLIFGLFLAIELPPVFWPDCPWSTLSGTAQHAERSYPIVRALCFGFLLGLLIHIVYEVKLWQALIFGFAVSFLTHFVHFRERV